MTPEEALRGATVNGARALGLQDRGVLDVGGEQITATQIVIATGARPMVPPIPGLDDVRYHTSDTIMRTSRKSSSITNSKLTVAPMLSAADLDPVQSGRTR